MTVVLVRTGSLRTMIVFLSTRIETALHVLGSLHETATFDS